MSNSSQSICPVGRVLWKESLEEVILLPLMLFIAYTFKGHVHVFAGRVKIVSHSSCRTSAILKYFCPLQVAHSFQFWYTSDTIQHVLEFMSLQNECVVSIKSDTQLISCFNAPILQKFHNSIEPIKSCIYN